MAKKKAAKAATKKERVMKKKQMKKLRGGTMKLGASTLLQPPSVIGDWDGSG